MKALTLTQPWATLVAVGAKTIETRGWATTYRGPLAIHAAKGFPADARLLALEYPFAPALQRVLERLPLWPSILPIGSVLAICTLASCHRSTDPALELSEQDRAFGDFSPGRYAWVLSDIHQFPQPIPARGALSLWEWSPSPETVATARVHR